MNTKLSQRELGALVAVLWEAHGMAVADAPAITSEPMPDARDLRMRLQALARNTKPGQQEPVALTATDLQIVRNASGIATKEMSRLDFQARIGLYPEEIEALMSRLG